ncbi:MAG: hypothetical protein JWN14_3676 [Chthonomonadales bacterium]|nr:hypothetical protein [Chthonomonadales bacterium]
MPAALTCADVRAREWDFVEGTLPIPERAAVQTHLDACESCRTAMTLCRSAEDALLSASAHIPAAGDLRAGFYARLATQQRPMRRYGRPMIALYALAAGLLVVALIRPMFPISSVSPPHSGETAALSFGFTPPVLTPTEPPVRITSTLHAFNHGFGLTEAQIDRLLASEDVKAITPQQHRKTFHRQVSPAVVAVVDRRAMFGRPTNYNRSRESALPTPRPPFREAALDTAKRDIGPSKPMTLAGNDTFAKDRSAGSQTADHPALTTSLADRALKMQIQAGTSTMPLDDGVSFDVIDQDRGFSNSTRIASNVEQQGDDHTVYIEADGN